MVAGVSQVAAVDASENTPPCVGTKEDGTAEQEFDPSDFGMLWPPKPLPRVEWCETTTVHSYGNSSAGLRNDLRNDASITSKLPSGSNAPSKDGVAGEPRVRGARATPRSAKDGGRAPNAPLLDTRFLSEAAASATGGELQPQLGTSVSATKDTQLTPAAPVATPKDVATGEPPLKRSVQPDERSTRVPTPTTKSRRKRAHVAEGVGTEAGVPDPLPAVQQPKKRRRDAPAGSVLLEAPVDTVPTPFAADFLVRRHRIHLPHSLLNH